MGLYDRVTNLVRMVETKAMAKAVEKTFSDCGNCNRRVMCSSSIVPVRKLFKIIAINRTFPVEPTAPSIAAARIYKAQCATCDKTRICIELWASRNQCKDLVTAVHQSLQQLNGMSEHEAASQIEGWLRELELSGTEVLAKAAKMWWQCEKKGKYENPLTICRSKYLKEK